MKTHGVYTEQNVHIYVRDLGENGKYLGVGGVEYTLTHSEAAYLAGLLSIFTSIPIDTTDVTNTETRRAGWFYVSKHIYHSPELWQTVVDSVNTITKVTSAENYRVRVEAVSDQFEPYYPDEDPPQYAYEESGEGSHRKIKFTRI